MSGGFWKKIDSWYSNIGEKIKKLSKWLFIIEAVLCLIGGFVIFVVGITNTSWSRYKGDYSDPIWEMVIGGLIFMIVVPIISFVSSWILYAFGHLVQITEDNYELNARQKGLVFPKSKAQTKIDNKRLEKIESLRSAGMITEEEYLEAIAKANNGGEKE